MKWIDFHKINENTVQLSFKQKQQIQQITPKHTCPSLSHSPMLSAETARAVLEGGGAEEEDRFVVSFCVGFDGLVVSETATGAVTVGCI